MSDARDNEDAPLGDVEPRLYRLSDVAVLLSTSLSQVRALVRSGDLPAMRMGGRGQWRVDRARLEAWIHEQHEATQSWIKDNPFSG